MLNVLLAVIIIILAVLLILYICGVFKKKDKDDDESPISKDGKNIKDLELESACASLKKNGFTQSDDELKNMLALSYIFSGMKKEDIKTIVEELNKKNGKSGSSASSTKEGSSSSSSSKSNNNTSSSSKSESGSSGSSSGKGKDGASGSSSGKDKDGSSSGSNKDVEKIEKFNKSFRSSVFAKDGVEKTLADDSKNKQARELLLSMKDKNGSSSTKTKVPSNEKIIKKYKVERIDKDSKDLKKQAEWVFGKFVDEYEKILNGSIQM